MEHAPPSCFCVCVSVSDKTFKLKFKLQQLGSNFGDLYEQLLALWISETPDSSEAALILFGSCKHFESEFNPEGLKKMNSPHLIPHPELMKRGTLGFFFPPAYDSALWDLQKGQTAKQHVVGIVELATSACYWRAFIDLQMWFLWMLPLIMILSFYLC